MGANGSFDLRGEMTPAGGQEGQMTPEVKWPITKSRPLPIPKTRPLVVEADTCQNIARFCCNFKLAGR